MLKNDKKWERMNKNEKLRKIEKNWEKLRKSDLANTFISIGPPKKIEKNWEKLRKIEKNWENNHSKLQWPQCDLNTSYLTWSPYPSFNPSLTLKNDY